MIGPIRNLTIHILQFEAARCRGAALLLNCLILAVTSSSFPS